MALEIEFVTLSIADVSHASTAFASSQREKGRVFFLEKHLKGGSGRNGIEVTQNSAKR
jgi:hypothetical protein